MALGTGQAGDVDLAHHPLSEYMGRSDLDLAHELVAESAEKPFVPPGYFNVGVADAGPQDADQRLVRTGDRNTYGVKGDLARETKRAHRLGNDVDFGSVWGPPEEKLGRGQGHVHTPVAATIVGAGLTRAI